MSSFAEAWQQWHDKHERQRTDPHGFLAVTSLNFLDATPRRFPDAPGTWHLSADGVVVVELAEGESLTVDGAETTGTFTFPVITERGGINARYDDAVIEVAKRGGLHLIRPRHPENELRTSYRRTPAFPPDEKWALDARFVPFDQPRAVTVGAAVEGLEHVYESSGRIEFTAGGQDLALTVFNGFKPGLYLAVFTDATSGVTTYAANRSVIVTTAADGTAVLDFNRATNLPCAYTEFGTCPLPPPENRLPIAVEAGEKYPFERTDEISREPRS
ncbi:DUF1684 domain-containing protein [Actinoplanes sp. NBRC 103695]|uniref:DUF1684 domain-containing protein n=1 Tax=Actinoplanes sp. NBRC 103695 TaxID=3032202 RepID=UPI0024A02647|nr:DUF1684 domain-containing protein [Actinoplanes sp. NBRC 103695]GLY97276.1 hypothetical protein Acsp02_45300 [Actinoplanes sp. NBRC 103695]